MPEEHHAGGCQCGAVRYEVDVDLSNPIACNCSRCRRLGSMLVFTPREKFTLLSGADNLTEYLFASRTISHLFCRTCGIESFAFGVKPDGTAMAAVNVNCLDGVDPWALQPFRFDGAAH